MNPLEQCSRKTCPLLHSIRHLFKPTSPVADWISLGLRVYCNHAYLSSVYSLILWSTIWPQHAKGVMQQHLCQSPDKSCHPWSKASNCKWGIWDSHGDAQMVLETNKTLGYLGNRLGYSWVVEFMPTMQKSWVDFPVRKRGALFVQSRYHHRRRKKIENKLKELWGTTALT